MVKEIWEWTRALALAAVIAFVMLVVIRPTMVKGDSMVPTLENNHYLITERIFWQSSGLERNDIVVFNSSLVDSKGKERDLIKRVIGVPGDHVTIGEGLVSVNGVTLAEPYLNTEETEGAVDAVVPPDHIFVLGDNRLVSIDSRDDQVGMVPLDKVKGRVLFRLLPLHKIGTIGIEQGEKYDR